MDSILFCIVASDLSSQGYSWFHPNGLRLLKKKPKKLGIIQTLGALRLHHKTSWFNATNLSTQKPSTNTKIAGLKPSSK
jgi:hypothetical protein